MLIFELHHVEGLGGGVGFRSMETLTLKPFKIDQEASSNKKISGKE